MNTIRHLTQLTLIAACLAAAVMVRPASAADHAAVRVVQLPNVVVTAHRLPAVVELPRVTVVAKRIAAEPVRVVQLPLVVVTAKRLVNAPVIVASRDGI